MSRTSWLRHGAKEPNNPFKRTDSRKWFGLPSLIQTPPLRFHFIFPMSISSRISRNKVTPHPSSKPQTWGKSKRPENCFWAALRSFTRVLSRPSTFRFQVGKFLALWRWMFGDCAGFLGAALMNGCVYTWSWTILRNASENNTQFNWFIHSLMRIAFSHA